MRYYLPYAIPSHIFQLLSAGLLIYIIVKRPNPTGYFLPLFFYATTYCLADMFSTVTAFFHIHNIKAAYIYYPLEYIFISWLYLTIYPMRHKRYIIMSIPVGLLVFALGFFFKGTSGHNFIGMSVLHTMLLIIAGRFFVWHTAKGQTELKYDPLFYVTLGIMLDCGITAISYILFDTFDFRLPFYFNSISDCVTSAFVFTGIFFLYKSEMAVLKILQEAEQESSPT